MKIKLQNCNMYVEDLGHKLYVSLLIYYEFYLSNFYLLSFTNMVSKMSMQHWGSCVWELWEEEWGLEGSPRREKTVENKMICFVGAQRCETHHPVYAKFQSEYQAHFQEMKIV